MPSFGRIGRHSNKSQHNLLEQQQHQQQQQQQQHQQQQPAIQPHQAEQPATQLPLHLQQQQQREQIPAAAGSGSGSGGDGGALPLPQSASSVTSPAQPTLGLRRVSTTGTGIGPDPSSNPPSASPGPPPLSSTESFHRQQPQQQPPPSPSQQRQSQLVDTRTGPPPLPHYQQQQQLHQLQHQHQHQHHQQHQQFQQPPHHQQRQPTQPQSQPQTPQHQHPPPPPQQVQQQQQQQQQHQPQQQQQQHPSAHFPLTNLNNGHPRDLLRNANPNLPPPPGLGPNAIPLNQPNPNSSPLPSPNPAVAYNARQQPQPRDNFAELVSRSQSARYSQHIPPAPLQTQPIFGIGSSSADDLSQTASAGSPVVHPGPPSFSHSQTAPSEPKRSARKLIKQLIGSSNRPTTNNSIPDTYAHEPPHDHSATGIVRRPSKRSSNTPKANPLLTRSIDHPDWVPPQRSSSRPQAQPQQQSQPQQQHIQSPLAQLQQPQPPPQQQQQQIVQQSPTQGTGKFDGPYPVGRTSQDLLTRPSPAALQSAENSPYDQDLAFHQQQAIAQHQAQLLQEQGHTHSQPQPDQQQQLYGQIVVDPVQSPYPYAHPQEQHQRSNPSSVYVGHLTTETPQPPNPETVSQLSHESPTTDSEQAPDNFHSAQESPAVSQAPHEPQLPSAQQEQEKSQAAASSGMPPPPPSQPGAAGPGRPSADNDRPPPGPPPAYRHSQGPVNATSPLPATAAGGNTSTNFRPTGAGERQQYEGSGAEDRNRTNSPQPAEGVDHEKQFKDLVTKYKNVKRLYFDGKTQIEQMTSQIEHLQNAVANQRLSQSRTALDDNEYLTRFNRLNGAINNLAFNIRKDWNTLPGWIEKYVTAGAVETGKQEMTAVGRAIISRWVMEEIFNKCFHPALMVDLSCQLKQIERNIRRYSYTMNSQEELDALTAKVVTWRMATLEGLQHLLSSPESAEHRADFTKMTTTNLTAALYQYLSDPPPAGVDGSASMIVELAVGIAANLPLESRDVALTYPMPGDSVQSDIMELERQPLPPLVEAADEAEENARDADRAAQRERTRSGMLTMLGGAPNPASSRKGSTASILTDTTTPAASTPNDSPKVRFAGFVGVEVRGRQVLMKAPVWSIA
ncbi:hypothetical protein F4777DRAFT_574359 [Nemania sp. FL0916]|nr:hypothetical protein F4777DRAFT_574359 [Nemania sp. FL0916]